MTFGFFIPLICEVRIDSFNKYGQTVEDWDLNSLKIGEAIVGLPFFQPFRFHFDMYK